MKKHNGMRPHDIAILIKIAQNGMGKWQMKDLAQELMISSGEVSESLNRSAIAGLISSDKKTINKLAFLDFLQFGLRYVFPQQPGAITRGMPTAISAPPLNNSFISDDIFVWPYGKGNARGQAIEPLHPNTPEACLNDPRYYELMALVDAIRIGKARERRSALEHLKEKFDNA